MTSISRKEGDGAKFLECFRRDFFILPISLQEKLRRRSTYCPILLSSHLVVLDWQDLLENGMITKKLLLPFIWDYTLNAFGESVHRYMEIISCRLTSRVSLKFRPTFRKDARMASLPHR